MRLTLKEIRSLESPLGGYSPPRRWVEYRWDAEEREWVIRYGDPC